jgi:hypothetical protein
MPPYRAPYLQCPLQRTFNRHIRSLATGEITNASGEYTITFRLDVSQIYKEITYDFVQSGEETDTFLPRYCDAMCLYVLLNIHYTRILLYGADFLKVAYKNILKEVYCK